jgi:hypothetical protein
MNASRAYDPSLHEEGSVAASGRCSHHQRRSTPAPGARKGAGLSPTPFRMGCWVLEAEVSASVR